MKLFELDQAIESLIDPETGEIEDFSALEALQMERDQKCENIALYIKNLDLLIAGLKEQEDILKERRQTATNKQEQLKDFLAHALDYRKFETTKCSVSFRKTTSAVVDKDKFIKWAEETGSYDFLNYGKPKANLSSIKDALKDDIEIPYAALETRQSITVK